MSVLRGTSRPLTALARSGAAAAPAAGVAIPRSIAAFTAPRTSPSLPRPRAFATTPLSSWPAYNKNYVPDSEREWLDKGIVTYDELKPITKAPPPNITLIDVREPSETINGMIPSAVGLPLSELYNATDLRREPEEGFTKRYSFKRPAFDDRIIVYCRSGKRSQQALEMFQGRGWWNVRNYEGSWLDWNAQEDARGRKDDEDDD